MSIFGSLNISATGLSAERMRMDVISSNLANANTTRTEEGGPYRRKEIIFTPFAVQLSGAQAKSATRATGVRVAGVVPDQTPLRQIYDPGHPDADDNGYVAMPNVNVVTEMVDMISASRSYEANATAFQTAKTMAQKALEIGR